MDTRLITALLAGLLLCLLSVAACDGGNTVAVTPQITLERAALDFGEVPVLVTRTASLRLTNTGRAPLALFDVRLDGAGDDLAIAQAPTSIDSGGEAWIALDWRPERLGGLDAILRFATDDPEAPLIAVPLTGISTTQGKLEHSAALDFDGQCEGSEALGQIELRSTGTAALVITGIAIEPTSENAFSLLGSARTPITIPSGESIALIVRHAPPFGAEEPRRARLVIDSSDPTAPRLDIPLDATLDRAPLAHIAPFPGLAPGALLTLDGSASDDPDGPGPLTFAWTLDARPADSKSAIAHADAPEATLEIDAPGTYDVALRVTDAAGCVSRPAFRTALAQTAEALRVELFWDNLQADLDLHLVPDPDDFFDPSDCHFADGHLAPDWGVPGDASDDPLLLRDALTGYGPEIISFPAPSAGRYRALVHYFSAHHAAATATLATLRLYRFGVLVFESRQTLGSEGARWEAFAVAWPGGELFPIDVCEACE
ncbi:MAG: choice-of-anchor D domain-containing protein [Myxococcales bacterium]|jgi:hypothetical protein|nr:choice-of-anchor D domain-containing protein [Myxococcales bacterium]